MVSCKLHIKFVPYSLIDGQFLIAVIKAKVSTDFSPQSGFIGGLAQVFLTYNESQQKYKIAFIVI